MKTSRFTDSQILAVLKEGDAVTVTKDLTVKGSADTLKRGTTLKNIRRVEGDQEVIESGQGCNIVVLKTCSLRRA